jgi:glycerol kinase
MSWRDTRGAAIVSGLADRKDRIFEATGLPLTPYYSASKIRWIFENIPASRERTAVFGTVSSFLAQRLTGRPRAAVDHTNASRTQLMNIRTLEWDPELRGLFGLRDIRLPEIVPTANDHGRIATSSGPVPLLACIGDQQAALLGLGVTAEGQAGINYGTGAFLLINTGTSLRTVSGLMASVHYSTERERYYLLEGSVNAAGDALEWLRSRFGLFSGYEAVDDLCWKAATDVIAFLGLNGTGAPHWERGISSAFHGLTAESGPEDVVRGAVECIAFFLQDIAETAHASGVGAASIVASGGLTSLSYLVQVQADLSGREIIVSPAAETSALGAAFLAGLGHGAWTASAIHSLARSGETVPPRVNTGLLRRRRRWTALHRAVRELDRI